MARDLFQIDTERDMHLTMGLWAMLSPHPSQRGNKSFENQNYHRFKKTNVKDRRNADVS
jgi:hypothetical protein